MSDSNIPIIAAVITTVGAFVAACVALFVGIRNSRAAMTSAAAALRTAQNAGTHRVAQSRQEWINNVIDTLSEHHSIATTAEPASQKWSEDRRRLEYLRTKLEILLNPGEEATQHLLHEMDKVHASLMPRSGEAPDAEMVRAARHLLKGEWKRIKIALGEEALDSPSINSRGG
jgi:hypothetical protein